MKRNTLKTHLVISSLSEGTYGQICPSNGTISYEKGILNCEKHPGKESSDDETEEIPYI